MRSVQSDRKTGEGVRFASEHTLHARNGLDHVVPAHGLVDINPVQARMSVRKPRVADDDYG